MYNFNVCVKPGWDLGHKFEGISDPYNLPFRKILARDDDTKETRGTRRGKWWTVARLIRPLDD